MEIPRKKGLDLEEANKSYNEKRFNIILVRNLVTIPMNGGTRIQPR